MAAMDSALRDHPVVRTPRLLGIDHDRRLAAFELLEDASTAADTYNDRQQDPSDAL